MRCALCDWQIPDAHGGFESFADHLRAAHPGLAALGFERWPDGSLVVVDTTLEPQDFADPDG